MLTSPPMKRTIAHLVLAVCVAGSLWADPAIQSVQQALKDQKFYYGKITGEKNADTTAAIRRYQIRNGLQVTGEVDSETLRSLKANSNSPSASQSTSNPAVTQSDNVRRDDAAKVGQNSQFAPRSEGREFDSNAAYSSAYYKPAPSRADKRMVVAELQRQLITRGYYRGSIDGRYARRTALAVRAFQFASGLSPTGHLDPSTLDALGLSDPNLASVQPTARPDENWVPITKFKHGKWKLKWQKKYYRADGEEYGSVERRENSDASWNGPDDDE